MNRTRIGSSMYPKYSQIVTTITIAACLPVYGQTNVPAGIINTDTVWSASGSPYFLEGNILVAPGTTLTIHAGVEVHFQLAELGVGGRLIARGEMSDRISFLLDEGDRGRIHFTPEASDGSVLSYCSFEFMTLDVQRAFPLVEFCSFGQSTSVKKIEPFDFRAPSVIIRDCSFSDTSDASFVDLDTFVFERNIGLAQLFLLRVSDIRIQNNTITHTGDPLVVWGAPASITGIISGNIFVGRYVVIKGFVGQVTQNTFSIDQLQLDGTGGTWLRNDFTFKYEPGKEDVGVDIRNIPGFMAFNDNNFTPLPNFADRQLILWIHTGFGSVIDAERNWWSTTDATSIESAIYHFVDSGALPFVDFMPFRMQPVGFCATDADCIQDGLFCNGDEICGEKGECQSTGNPCTLGFTCQEDAQRCDECQGEVDNDKDGVLNDCDNCVDIANADQLDTDLDGIGDVCDDDLICDTHAECDDDNVCTIETCNDIHRCEFSNEPDGTSCEDGFFCTINDICVVGNCVFTEVNPLCIGTPGISCWDSNGNGIGDLSEDINSDGNYDTLDCQGPGGPPGLTGDTGNEGPQGEQGPASLSCWDLDGDGIGDLEEDVNGDGNYDAHDCQGAGAQPCDEDDDCQDGLFCNGVEFCNNDFCRHGPLPCDSENETCLEDANRCVPADIPPGQTITDDSAPQSVPMCGTMSGLTMILMFLSLAVVRFNRGNWFHY